MTNAIENARNNLFAQCETRISYEIDKASQADESVTADNLLIAKKLRKQRDSLNHENVLQLAIDFNVAEFDFFNVHKRSNERFNIYAIEKIAKILRNVVKADSMSKHCYNVLFNALKLRDAIESDKFEYTRSHVKSTVSAHYRDAQSKAVSKLAKRCETVSASTASTQASSTINALVVLHVAKLVKASDMKQEKLKFDYDHKVFSLI